MPGKLLDFSNASQPFKIKAKTETKAEIIIYDQIGESYFGDGLSAKKFSEQLKALPDSIKEIDVRINSPGGSCFEGITIFNRLKQHKAKITVHIDGLAASIASIIMLAGDEIIISEGALIMVHLPWTMAMGNRRDFEEQIETLMTIEEQMISIYSRKTGLERNEIKRLMEAETWMDAQEALERGFVTAKMGESIPVAASLMKHGWMSKAPKIKSQTQVTKQKALELKQKIEARIARK